MYNKRDVLNAGIFSKEKIPNRDMGQAARLNDGTYIVYGRNPVKEYLYSHVSVNALYIVPEAKGISDIIALARDKNIPVKEVSRDRLEKMCDGGSTDVRNGGVAVELAAAQYCEVSDILALAAERGEPPFIVISDGIADPHNLGAIIRTAEAAGAHGIVIPRRGGVSVTPAVVSASAGAAAHFYIARVANIAESINFLKKENVFIYGAAADGVCYRDVSFAGAVALVIGNEGDGLRRLTRERCDGIVGIDMYGKTGSLNASVSAGILLYEVVRVRAGVSV